MRLGTGAAGITRPLSIVTWRHISHCCLDDRWGFTKTSESFVFGRKKLKVVRSYKTSFLKDWKRLAYKGKIPVVINLSTIYQLCWLVLSYQTSDIIIFICIASVCFYVLPVNQITPLLLMITFTALGRNETPCLVLIAHVWQHLQVSTRAEICSKTTRTNT